MSATKEETFAMPSGKYLVDCYEDWARGQGVPVHAAQWLDLFSVGTEHWPLFGVKGAICHLVGHCDFLTLFLLEIDSGQCSSLQGHIHEEMYYVLCGSGIVEIEDGNCSTQQLEWRGSSQSMTSATS